VPRQELWSGHRPGQASLAHAAGGTLRHRHASSQRGQTKKGRHGLGG
jgi:hypothetical protein